MRVFVACSSNEVGDSLALAYEMGSEIAKRGHTLVFGGSYVGAMKSLADGAFESKGDIIGIIPECYKELGFSKCSKLICTKNILERKQGFLDHSDAFIILPGGLGTLDEFFSVFEELRSGIIDSPVVILNHEGHFDKFLEYISDLHKKDYIRKQDMELLVVCDNMKDTLDYIESISGEFEANHD